MHISHFHINSLKNTKKIVKKNTPQTARKSFFPFLCNRLWIGSFSGADTANEKSLNG